MSWPDVASAALRENPSESRRRWLAQLARLFSRDHLGLPLDVEARDLAQAGWAVVFHAGEKSAVRRALEPLVEHRRRQAGDARVRVLTWQSGESWLDWLEAKGVTAGTVRPEKVPYYLLLVGEPTAIPFDAQHHLALEYAVGRISFSRPEDYRCYAESVVAYESEERLASRRTAAFFAPRHDGATRLSEGVLVQPLASSGLAERRGFAVRALRGREATRDALGELFDGEAPAVLFSASHGLCYKAGARAQEELQGALVCQPPTPDVDPARDSFKASDVRRESNPHGLIAFLFACYSAGTPRQDEFLRTPTEAAPRPFLAALPRALLAHPRGGALAVVGHVDRAWCYSIRDRSGRGQTLPFENTLQALLAGWPVGHALRDFRQRFAVLSTRISQILEKKARFGLAVPDQERTELARAWMERNDARNYAVLGDPAVHLRPDAMAPPKEG